METISWPRERLARHALPLTLPLMRTITRLRGLSAPQTLLRMRLAGAALIQALLPQPMTLHFRPGRPGTR